MSSTDRERVSHVVRRLSMGAHPEIVSGLDSVDAAVARSLDLSHSAPKLPTIVAPASYDAGKGVQAIVEPIEAWVGAMRTSPRLIEERLVWFWHDHFATGIQKVHVPYLMWQQHLTIRKYATGSFSDLLHAMAKDPAMLVYLDGITNAARNPNENFGREVMELFTLGRGNYTQDDVVAASRSFTGWTVNVPGRPASAVLDSAGVPPWTAGLIPSRHDNTTKTLLGTTGNLDMDHALDVLLNHPATAPRIAGKLYTELTGIVPDDATAKRVGKVFKDANWDVMKLVAAIVTDKGFTASSSVRSRVRSPLEKLVSILQAFPDAAFNLGTVALKGRTRRTRPDVGQALLTMGYVPFAPPNVAGFPKGASLLGPHQLVHTFDLLSVFPSAPKVPKRTTDLLARFGLFDVSDRTKRAIDKAPDPGTRLALTIGSPEFAAV